MLSQLLLAASLGAVLAVAQRPSNTSICDFYTIWLYKHNNSQNQERLVIAVVNTAVIGNYTNDAQGTGVSVPGILAKDATFNGTAVDLMPYFDGSLASSNRGGHHGVAINFLDDGGAVPLTTGKASNGQSSNQFKLMNHLYEYFGALLGCSLYGTSGFPAYTGQTSMYQAHKFMALNIAEVGYFVEQIGYSAASFGVRDEDIVAIGASLGKAFAQRCSAAAAVLPSAPAQLQAICIDKTCPEAPDANCSAYEDVQPPTKATPSPTSSPSATSTKKNAASTGKSVAGSTGMMMLLIAIYCLLG